MVCEDDVAMFCPNYCKDLREVVVSEADVAELGFQEEGLRFKYKLAECVCCWCGSSEVVTEESHFFRANIRCVVCNRWSWFDEFGARPPMLRYG
jgi:hypothetical protein